MRGKISKEGTLDIFRVNKWKAQFCSQGSDEDHCGDWCPLFEELTDIFPPEAPLRIGLGCGIGKSNIEILKDEREEG